MVVNDAEDSSMRREDAAALLRDSGINPTSQRIDVAAVLFARQQHVCADDVLHLLSGNGTPVSKATVYNTLGLLARRGLVRELVVDSDRVIYDTNTTKHDHIYDMDTGALIDVDLGDVELGLPPNLPQGKVVADVDIVIRIRYPR